MCPPPPPPQLPPRLHTLAQAQERGHGEKRSRAEKGGKDLPGPTHGNTQGGQPVQILDPNRLQKLLGVWKGGGVSRSAAGIPKGGGGSVGT